MAQTFYLDEAGVITTSVHIIGRLGLNHVATGLSIRQSVKSEGGFLVPFPQDGFNKALNHITDLVGRQAGPIFLCVFAHIFIFLKFVNHESGLHARLDL